MSSLSPTTERPFCSDSKAVGIDGVIYRNGVAVYHSDYDVGLAVGSADAMHYTAVLAVSTRSGELVHDGRQPIATSGITGDLQPLISPDGAHYGVVSPGQGVNSIDGRAILPANGQGILGEVTDAGHWVLIGGKPGVPLWNGRYQGLPPMRL